MRVVYLDPCERGALGPLRGCIVVSVGLRLRTWLQVLRGFAYAAAAPRHALPLVACAVCAARFVKLSKDAWRGSGSKLRCRVPYRRFNTAVEVVRTNATSP